MPLNAVRVVAVATLAVTMLAACSNAGPGVGQGLPGASAGPPEGEKIIVVTSTNVWASVVRAVGGAYVDVHALVTDRNVNPHGYESTPTDAVTVRQAHLVVYNGAGHDSFVDQLLRSTGSEGKALQVHRLAKAQGTAADVEEEHAEAEDGATNTEQDDARAAQRLGFEHYWYDIRMVRAVASRVAEQLVTLAPHAERGIYANVKSFVTALDNLDSRATAVATAARGAKVMVTDPIAALLVNRLELTNLTPPGYAVAVEDGRDPSAALIGTIHRFVDTRAVALLLYNTQTESSLTIQVRQKAEAKRIPVVETSETLPSGKDYLQWMGDCLTGIEDALRER